jgi:flagellin-like hook-associated protein FlgL
MTRISSYGSYINTVRTLTGGQSAIDDLSTQLNTGKKSQDVAFFGTQSQRLLDLKSELVRRQAYSQTIDQTMTRVKSYDTLMDRMADMATELSSTTRLPQGPGASRVSSVVNQSAGAMKVSVDDINSKFKAEATYTISAVPSQTGPQGSFEITVTDGLGGRAVNTVNMKQVPPQVDADRFIISGGPGDGAIIKLNIESLEGSGISSFDVTWPDMASTREVVRGMTVELESLLNERVGDRYLFAGSRYNTKPVDDIVAAKQITRTTLVGERGDAGETYEMILNGKRFTYVTTGNEKSLDEVFSNGTGTGLVDQIRQFSDPPFNVTLSVSNGIVTATANDVKEKFTLTSRVYDNGTHENVVLTAPDAVNASEAPYTVQEASETQRQIDNVKFHGPEADVGDVFNISIGARTIVQNENAPPQVIIAGPTKYSYVISPSDTDILRGNASLPADAPGQVPSFTTPTSMSNWVAQRMAVQINADPAATVVASIDPADDTKLIFTAKDVNSQFVTTADINNAGNQTRLITKDIPPLAEQDVFEGIVSPPNLPFYDTDYATAQQLSPAYDIAKLQVDDGLSVNYGVSSNDPAIQKLVSGLRRLTAAINRPGDYTKLMEEGRNLLIDAQNQLRGVHSRVVNAAATMDNTQSRHQDAISKAQGELATIEGIDQNEVAVRLQSAMSTQQASYTITGRMQSLSLINFLA